MTNIARQLRGLIEGGICRIGQIAISADGTGFALVHEADVEGEGELEIHHGPDAARDISTYAEDGTYRFTKGRTDLKRGWKMLLADESALLLALDGFYPAAVGMFLAQRGGGLEIENLRDKLNRQTGMYRYARTISDAGAQQLVREVCGPAHACAKKILWQIDSETPLEDSPASRYDGVPSGCSGGSAIPLVCREACNHFVAECRKAAKAEAGVK